MDSEQLAEDHWQWLMKVLEVVYKGAFVHGYKHGKEDSDADTD